jgi:hypothetical protein
LGIAFLVGALLTGGTFRTEVTYQPPTLGELAGEVPFEQTITVRHWLGGLVQGDAVDLDHHLGRLLRDGEQITGISVETRHTVSDLLVSGLTLGIYTPETVIVRGRTSRVETVVAR